VPGWLLVGGKVVSCGLWSVFLINLVRPFPGMLHNVFLFGGLGLLVIHATECISYFRVIKEKGLSLPLDIIQVLLFGVFHVVMLRQRKLTRNG
jgi:uncharacterized protein YhhL (DUF1145 family)